MTVQFYRHGLTSDDADSVAAVLDTPFLTSGSVGKSVEAKISSYLGVEHSFLTNSWTNGALAVLLAMGVKPGDEVIVPAMTFIATANVAELLGATVKFVDVDYDTLLVKACDVECLISDKTKAIFVVHLYGQMCDMESFKALKARYPQVKIIEDAAHCFEGTRDGYRPGTWSDAAIFSFYATKNVTCGEGGAIVTRDAELAESIQKTRLHGMSAGAADRFKRGEYRHWDMECLGVKANLPDILAGLLPRQIDQVDDKLLTRQKIAARYREAFADLPVRMAKLSLGVSSAEHLFPISVPALARDEVISALNHRGIQVAVNYRAITELSYYRNKYDIPPETVAVSVEWGSGTISLPLYPSMPKEDQSAVIQAVSEIVES